MDAWIVSTKNTVSNNQPHHWDKVEQKQLRIGVVFLLLSLESSMMISNVVRLEILVYLLLLLSLENMQKARQSI